MCDAYTENHHSSINIVTCDQISNFKVCIYIATAYKC